FSYFLSNGANGLRYVRVPLFLRNPIARLLLNNANSFLNHVRRKPAYSQPVGVLPAGNANNRLAHLVHISSFPLLIQNRKGRMTFKRPSFLFSPIIGTNLVSCG